MAISPDNRGRISFCSLIYCQYPAQCLKCTWWLEVFLLNTCFRIPQFFVFFLKASGWGEVGRWKVTKIHPWKDQVARLSHEGTQLRVTGTDRLLCEAVQALSQTAWVQIPVLWLTSHAVISSLPSVSISPEQRLQKYFLPLGILCGLNELIQVKHLEQCLTRSKCLINGGCLCSILHVPCVPVAVVQYDHGLVDFSLLPGTWLQAEPQHNIQPVIPDPRYWSSKVHV